MTLPTTAAQGLTPAQHDAAAAADTAIVQGKLDNGLEIVVIPDRRAARRSV